jgi:hypothetical protein
METNEDERGNQVIWGVAAIGRKIGRNKRQTKGRAVCLQVTGSPFSNHGANMATPWVAPSGRANGPGNAAAELTTSFSR